MNKTNIEINLKYRHLIIQFARAQTKKYTLNTFKCLPVTRKKMGIRNRDKSQF